MNEESDPINEMIVESGLDPDQYADVAAALGALRDALPTEAPVPSPELAALLSGGVVTPLPGKRRAAIAAAVAAGVVACTSAAAAANVLPEPAQRMFSEFSHKYLPFDFPDPADRDDSGDAPVPQGGTTEAEHVDNGNHIGGGTGGGKTDNLGKHKGQVKPKPTPSPNPNAEKPKPPKPTNTGKPTAPPESKPSVPPKNKTNPGAEVVAPTQKPDKPKPLPTPKATPDPGAKGPGEKSKGGADG